MNGYIWSGWVATFYMYEHGTTMRIEHTFLTCAMSLLVVSSEATSRAKTALQPRFQVTAKVIDEAGNPVEGADVIVGYHVSGGGWSSEAPKFDRVEGETGADGRFTGSARTRSNFEVVIRVNKDGFYESIRDYEFDRTRVRRWVPWNPEIELLLKRKINPIPMYAKREMSERIPIQGEPVGYDFSRGDWVSPFGKGERADIHFHSDVDFESRSRYEGELTVSFPNEGDGLLEFRQTGNDYSELPSDQAAPTGEYQSQWSWINRRYRESEDSVRPTLDHDYDKDRHFYFRVRSEVDEHGNVIRANYGKFYGDIKFYPQTDGGSIVSFEYYFNPEPNNRSLEFHPRRNLLDISRSALRPHGP